MGVPRWEVEGSKWNSTVRGNCGNLDGRWQVRNNQWIVGNNLNWFQPLTALFHLLLDMMTMFFPISSSVYHPNIFYWLLFFDQLLVIMMKQQFLFSINIRYIHHFSTFLKVEKPEDSICFKYTPRSRDLLPTIASAQNCEKRESTPCQFHLSSWPSHLWGSQTEWTILDYGRAFPLHGEVMENSLRQAIVLRIQVQVLLNTLTFIHRLLNFSENVLGSITFHIKIMYFHSTKLLLCN